MPRLVRRVRFLGAESRSSSTPDDQVVPSSLSRGSTQGSNGEILNRIGYVCHVPGPQDLWSVESSLDRDEALEAAGLSE